MSAAIQMNIAAGVIETCAAFTAEGNRCVHHGRIDGLCKTHANSRDKNGPFEFEIKQLKIVQKTEMAALKARLSDAEEYHRERTILKGRHAEAMRDLKASHARRSDDEKRRQEEVSRAARERQEANHRRFEEYQRQLDETRRARLEQVFNDDVFRLEDAVRELAGIDVLPAGRELHHIANDSQSVHTSVVVKQTKEIVAKVRTVPVPEEYRWNKDICSKTPGEIIAECRVSATAAWQMMSQYAQDTNIYDIEEGIYGKVLDSVWQFVKTHAEKESLIAILRTELNDNVGMCAQGNLTRICNILSGYMDGVGVTETLAEKLGRLLPPLRLLDRLDERRARVEEILRENEVPAEEWDTWIDAVMDE